MKLKEYIRNLFDKVTNLLPIKKMILFESNPDYSDNTKAVFDEMLKRGLNNKFKLVWVCDKTESIDYLQKKFKDVNNVDFIYRWSRKFMYYYLKTSCCFIVCNRFIEKSKKKQYYIYLEHGCTLKDTSNYYFFSKSCSDCDIAIFSEYLIPYEAKNLKCNENQFRVLGFPRNDTLINQNKTDLKALFPDKSFEKCVYWMPTYRQHKSVDIVHSNIAMPILYNESIAAEINKCAGQNDILIVIKPHPAQDVSRIKKLDLDNLVFIDDDFFRKNDIDNYLLLANCDALITDYSSVYYDYLLCDKPIGLCWDDFEEYNKREGFAVDPHFILKGGVKIYNSTDMCSFISDVAKGIDTLCRERNEIKNIIHNYSDGNSTKRVTDYIEKEISRFL
ncbi:MAG: CDP-glycerol glycerophosphotransferase family protein [Eubacterium sp.]